MLPEHSDRIIALLTEIRDALVRPKTPGETIRRVRREEIARSIGQAEAHAARHRASKAAGVYWGDLGRTREAVIQKFDRQAAALRAELARMEEEG